MQAEFADQFDRHPLYWEWWTRACIWSADISLVPYMYPALRDNLAQMDITDAQGRDLITGK